MGDGLRTHGDQSWLKAGATEAYVDAAIAAAAAAAGNQYPNPPTTATFPFQVRPLNPGAAVVTVTNRAGIPGVRQVTPGLTNNHISSEVVAWPTVGGHKIVSARLDQHIYVQPRATSTLAGCGLVMIYDPTPVPTAATLALAKQVTLCASPDGSASYRNIVAVCWNTGASFNRYAVDGQYTAHLGDLPKWFKVDYDTATGAAQVYFGQDASDGDIGGNWLTAFPIATSEMQTFLGGHPTHCGIFVDGVNMAGTYAQVQQDCFSFKLN